MTKTDDITKNTSLRGRMTTAEGSSEGNQPVFFVEGEIASSSFFLLAMTDLFFVMYSKNYQ